jgi:hypothetical protein
MILESFCFFTKPIKETKKMSLPTLKMKQVEHNYSICVRKESKANKNLLFPIDIAINRRLQSPSAGDKCFNESNNTRESQTKQLLLWLNYKRREKGFTLGRSQHEIRWQIAARVSAVPISAQRASFVVHYIK